MPGHSKMIERVKGAIMSSARDCGVSFSGGEYVARAAIAAMREPTQEMVFAGERAIFEEYELNAEWDAAKEVIENLDIIKLWRAMHAAALAEKEAE